MHKNIELTMRIRNAALIKAVIEDVERCETTLEKWCKVVGISSAFYQDLITFKTPPVHVSGKKDGEVKDKVKAICNMLNMEFEELFDIQLYEGIAVSKIVTYVTPEKLRQICNTPVERPTAIPTEVLNNVMRRQLDELLESLTPREEKILRMRFGLDEPKEFTLQEIGEDFNLSRDRIRQIEKRALKKLRNPNKSILVL